MVCKDVRRPIINGYLATEVEPRNNYDRFAVAVLKEGRIVGHTPKELSKYRTVVLLSGERITWEATGKHENKIRSGLDVPCIYRIKGPKYMVKNVELFINEHLERSEYQI